MLHIPHLGSLPCSYTSSTADALAAQCALALLEAGHAEPAARRRLAGSGLEHATLSAQLEDWMRAQNRRLTLCQLAITLHTGGSPTLMERNEAAPHVGLMLHNLSRESWGEVLHLAPVAPRIGDERLVRTALATLQNAAWCGMPLWLPVHTLDEAMAMWWEYDEDGYPEGLAPEDGTMTRADFDAALPPYTTGSAKGKRIPPYSPATLKRIAAGRPGLRRALARATLALQAACRPAIRAARSKNAIQPRSMNEDGYTAMGEAVVVRWDENDPTARLFDDLANLHAGSTGVTEDLFWIDARPADVPAALGMLEARITVLAAAEVVLALIAEPG